VIVAVALIVALSLVDLALVAYVAWPATYPPQHMARRPMLDELEAAVSASRRQVRRSLHPWAQRPPNP
jgi:hypothetical protein